MRRKLEQGRRWPSWLAYDFTDVFFSRPVGRELKVSKGGEGSRCVLGWALGRGSLTEMQGTMQCRRSSSSRPPSTMIAAKNVIYPPTHHRSALVREWGTW